VRTGSQSHGKPSDSTSQSNKWANTKHFPVNMPPITV
jgi:hypothetical protein